MGTLRFFLGLMGIAGAVALGPWAAHACSVCGGPAAGTDPGTGFDASFLFLLAMPYVVVGVIVGWLIYVHRRAARRQEKQGRRVGMLRGRREMA
jgi:hypothetical protein